MLCVFSTQGQVLPPTAPSSVAVGIPGAALAVTVHHVGVQSMVLPVENGSTVLIEASADSEAWMPVHPVLESEVFTNAFSEVVTPASWHFTTNSFWTTNTTRDWFSGVLQTNIYQVTEITTIVDSWQTNPYPHLAWRVQGRESTNAGPFFLRVRTTP